jgi:hypothetical protein
MARYNIRKIILAVVASGVVSVGVLAMPAGASTKTSCKEIRAAHAFFAVTAQGSVSCGTARHVLGEFMGGSGVKHGGPPAYQEWWSLGPWRCSYGAGAGSCFRDGSNYLTARATINADWTAWECGYQSGGSVPCRKG